MGIECFRTRVRLWACGAGLVLAVGGPALADPNAEADESSRTGVAARSTVSTAASGRAPLAARILSGARAPLAPEPDAEPLEEAGSPVARKPVAGKPASSSIHRTASPGGGTEARDGGEVSQAVSERSEAAPQRGEADRLASRNPVGRANGPSGETADGGTGRQNLAIPAAATLMAPRAAVRSGPAGTAAAAGPAAGEGARDRRQASVDEPRQSGQPSTRSTIDPPPGASPPPVAKPSKNRWGLFRWFNPEWIRPAEPLPMVPTPWSYGRGSEGQPRRDEGEGGRVAAADELSRGPRTQVALPRLSLDVRESVLEAAEGDQVSFRILLVNTGNRPAHDIDTTIYFAEGIEPEAFGGAEGSISSGEVRFETIEAIGPGEKVELAVRGRAGPPGIVVYRAEAIARETPGTLAREGAVTVIGNLFGPEEQSPE
jgi:hypothetical protein